MFGRSPRLFLEGVKLLSSAYPSHGKDQIKYLSRHLLCLRSHFAHRLLVAFTIAALLAADRTRFLTPLNGDCRKAFLAAKAKGNLTERSATASNNTKVTSMVENIISGLYLVGDVALLGLLVYNSHKPHNKIKRGWSDIYESEPIKGLRQQLHGLQGPQGKR